MLCTRIIPCLDIKDARVVKGIQFVQLKDAGDPLEVAVKYANEGADELCFLDITASVQKRKIISELVSRIADEIFIPFTVGGGITSIEDIEAILHAGADKISLNTAAFQKPELILNAARIYGSQCIVCAIDVRKNSVSKNTNYTQENSTEKKMYEVFLHGGRTPTGVDAIEWAKKITELGAGEILLTSMDRDGTGLGYDIDLLKKVRENVRVPVIASGGVGNIDHMIEAVKVAKADALLAASIFHFGTHSIKEVKNKMATAGLSVRL